MKAIRVGFISREIPPPRIYQVEYVVPTDNYVTAEEAAIQAIKEAGLEGFDNPIVMFAVTEIIEPIEIKRV
jgi:hypothetical protein